MNRESGGCADESVALTVITVTRNNAEGLRRTLKSVISQISTADIEHIIWDGLSDDGSQELAERYVVDSRHPVTVVSQRDAGIYDAMNRAAELGRGRFLYFLNAGDEFYEPRALTEAVALIRRVPRSCKWLVTRVALGGPEGPEKPFFSKGLPFARSGLWSGRQWYSHQGVLLDRVLFGALGGHDLEAGFAADLKLIQQFSVTGDPPVLDCTFARYEGGGASSTLIERMPLVFAHLRAETLGLKGAARTFSNAYGTVQLLRRAGLRAGIEVWRRAGRTPWKWPER